MSLHTVFFDLDGTLTDSAPGILNCVRYALDRMGIDPGDRATAENFIGPPLVQSFARHYGMDATQAQRALILYRERFSTIGLFENSVFDGIPTALETLQAAGMRLVIATSKPEVYTVRILEHFDLTRHFTHVAGSLLDGTRDEKLDVLRYAMALCGLSDGSGCAMVGDRATDLEAAHACGMRAVGVRWGGGSLEELNRALPDALVETPAALATALAFPY